MKSRRVKLPATVLERAKVAAESASVSPAKKSMVAELASKPRRSSTREKVVAALKKLHPMD